MKENSLEYFMQIVLDPSTEEMDRTLALQELRFLLPLPYEEENDYDEEEENYQEDAFDRDGWDDEEAYLSAGMGMDESYEW